jgi:SAM-dependent methyltransferase
VTPPSPRRSLRLALLLLPCIGLLAVACASADPSAAAGSAGAPAASAPATDYEPQRGQPGKDVVWVPTPDAVVSRMLAMAEVTADDLVVDLGSGDGKIAIAAVRERGARARGLEYNPDLVVLSKRRAQEAGVAARVEFIEADIFKSDFSDATVVTMYLLPGLNLRLRETLFGMKPGTRVVSHSFDMGAWEADERAEVGSASVFLWIIPANATGTWRVSAPRLEGAPQTLRFDQQFQMLRGQADFTTLTASVLQPRLDGARLSFTLRDERGGMLRFSGEVAGDRIAGTVSRGGGRAVPFEAERQGSAKVIGGLQPTEREARLMGEGV